MANGERVKIETPKGSVTGAWTPASFAIAYTDGRPAPRRRTRAPVLVLAPGAGSDFKHPFLTGFAEAIAGRGVSTLRFNFLYKERGRKSPDPEQTLRDVWLAAFEEATSRAKGAPVFAGGKSLGGRIASMCVADGMPAAGLVFLGYPLHPPGRPERIRDEHLYRIDVPILFMQGTRDPFADPKLLAKVLKKLGGRATHVEVKGGDHSFRTPGKRPSDHDIGAGLPEPAAEFIRKVSS
jgi:predicted alpha/beta-hydrolase family hydrolase